MFAFLFSPAGVSYCWKLNVCPPKFTHLYLTPKVMVFGGGVFGR